MGGNSDAVKCKMWAKPVGEREVQLAAEKGTEEEGENRQDARTAK
jgi:hypothetical protein